MPKVSVASVKFPQTINAQGGNKAEKQRKFRRPVSAPVRRHRTHTQSSVKKETPPFETGLRGIAHRSTSAHLAPRPRSKSFQSSPKPAWHQRKAGLNQRGHVDAR